MKRNRNGENMVNRKTKPAMGFVIVLALTCFSLSSLQGLARTDANGSELQPLAPLGGANDLKGLPMPKPVSEAEFKKMQDELRAHNPNLDKIHAILAKGSEPTAKEMQFIHQSMEAEMKKHDAEFAKLHKQVEVFHKKNANVKIDKKLSNGQHLDVAGFLGDKEMQVQIKAERQVAASAQKNCSSKNGVIHQGKCTCLKGMAFGQTSRKCEEQGNGSTSNNVIVLNTVSGQ